MSASWGKMDAIFSVNAIVYRDKGIGFFLSVKITFKNPGKYLLRFKKDTVKTGQACSALE
jgi:hypothetical protein